MHNFLFRELQLITVLYLIYHSYESKRKVRLSKTMYGVFHFQFCFMFLKFIFFFSKMHGLFDFKTS